MDINSETIQRSNRFSAYSSPLTGNVSRLDAEAKPANGLISAKGKIFSWKMDFNLRKIELLRQTAVACCANLRFSVFKSSSFFLSVFWIFPLSLLNKVFRFRHFWFSCRFILLICFRFHFLSTNSRKLSVSFSFSVRFRSAVIFW